MRLSYANVLQEGNYRKDMKKRDVSQRPFFSINIKYERKESG